MITRRIHPVIGLIVLVAYFLNLAAVAGGAVLCQNPESGSSIEFIGGSEHCSTSPDDEHDHDHDHDHEHKSAECCWCDACPCQDTPLAFDVVVHVFRDDDSPEGLAKSIAFDFVPHPQTVWPAVNQISFPDRSPPVPYLSHRQIRTIVLII